jgi:hypothetical protein
VGTETEAGFWLGKRPPLATTVCYTATFEHRGNESLAKSGFPAWPPLFCAFFARRRGPRGAVELNVFLL